MGNAEVKNRGLNIRLHIELDCYNPQPGRSAANCSVRYEEVEGSLTVSDPLDSGFAESGVAERVLEVVDRADREAVCGKRHRGHR